MISLDPSIMRDNPDLVRLNPELSAKETPKPRKYRNTPTVYRGREYDSAREAQYAAELDLRVKAGEIVGWVPQFPIPLEGGTYVADFLVILPDFSAELHEVKGEATRKLQTYRRNVRAVRERYGKEVKEVL